MRVVLVHRRLQRSGVGGGVSRLYYELGQAMAACDVDVVYLTGEPGWDDDSCDVVSLGPRRSRTAWRLAVADAVTLLSPDVAECHIWRAELGEVKDARTHARLVVRCDLCSANFGDRAEAARELALVHRADLALAVSHAVQEFVTRWARIVPSVIPLGVMPSTSANLTRQPTARRAVLWIGRPTIMKGFDRLVEAASVLPAWTFTGVMGPASSPMPLDRINIPNNLRLIRQVSEETLATLRANHDFIMCTARFEGFGLSILEGMANGLIPVIASDCGGPHDFVKDGVSGIVFTSPSSLATKVNESQLAKISLAAREIADTHTWKRAARATLDAYAR
jgi:glycosyltransferase involved in cell wall biosynthesis